MRVIYTIGLIIGVPLFLFCGVIASVWIDNFLTRHFGKPPPILIILTLAGWAVLLIKAAWDQAGKWLN